MADIEFPEDPVIGDVWPVSGPRRWIWDGVRWEGYAASGQGFQQPLISATTPINGVTEPEYPAQICLVAKSRAYICLDFAERIWKLITGGAGAVPDNAILYNGEPILYNGEYITYN